ncbi:MAG: hypothetical protein WKF86_00265 [Acidimicrobiales bacterium]
MTGWLVLLVVATYCVGRWSYAYELRAAAERIPSGHTYRPPMSHCRLVAAPFDQEAAP